MSGFYQFRNVRFSWLRFSSESGEGFTFPKDEVSIGVSFRRSIPFLGFGSYPLSSLCPRADGDLVNL
jgi:hypothetical protein